MNRPARKKAPSASVKTNLSTGKFQRKRSGSTYHHGDLASALVDAAEEALKDGKVAGLTVRALARRIGVTHMAAYHHYPNRATLLAAVAARGYDQLGQAMARRTRGLEPRSALRETGVAYVRFAVTHAAQFRLMFSAELDELRGEEPLKTHAAQSFAIFSGCLERAAPAAANIETAATAAWALMHGVSVLLLDRQLAGRSATARDAETLARAVLGEIRLRVLEP